MKKPDYHKEIDHLCKQLRKDLELYKRGSQSEKQRLMASMDEKMKLLTAAAEELRKAGTHKQEVKLYHLSKITCSLVASE